MCDAEYIPPVLLGDEWNYRVIYHDTSKPPYLAVHEVYYDKNGLVEIMCHEPVNVTGVTYEDMKEDFDFIAEAFDQSVLLYSEISKNWKIAQ